MLPWLFLGFAALLVATAVMVVVHRNPVTSALFLVLSFCSLAGIYLLLQAEFLGMVQIIVYAGAIMVLFLFVFIWVRWTFPRLRYDQLMNFGWKVLLPAAIVNVVIAGGWLYWRANG